MYKSVYTIEKIKNLLSPVFKEHNVKKAVLFGSYVNGNPREESDVDILVDSGLKWLRFYGLLEDVVTTLDKSVDLIDVSQIKHNSEIEKEIIKNGLVIY